MADPKRLAENEGKPIARRWIQSARAALARVIDGDRDVVAEAALSVSFRVGDAFSPEGRSLVLHVGATLLAVDGVLEDSARRFASVSEREASRVFPSHVLPDIPPAYAVFGDRVYFTPRFAAFDPSTGRGFGPMCRAAMVLHEAVHVIDRDSGAPDVHVSEWDEPRFSQLTPPSWAT